MLLRDLRHVYRNALGTLYSREETDHIFYLLLDHYLGLPRFVLGLEPDKTLLREEQAPLLKALQRLEEHEPLQYILGKVNFMDMELEVAPGVLIPRPETEGLVRWILKAYAHRDPPQQVLDVGTGSGCIAIALARAWPGARVHAVDRSEAALDIARRNGKAAGVQIQWEQKDMRTAKYPPRTFGLIVSNPPYIPFAEAPTLQPHVREQEPGQALFVPDEDPLLFYRELTRMGRQSLEAGGWLYVETHARFGPAVQRLFDAEGYAEIRLKKDTFGRDRYVRGCLNPAKDGA